jgi:hypothetical protein
MKQTYQIKTNDLPEIKEISNINGHELIYILKSLGLTQGQYARMITPPITTGAGINYYSQHKKLPFRLLLPLVEQYPPEFLLDILKKKYEL